MFNKRELEIIRGMASKNEWYYTNLMFTDLDQEKKEYCKLKMKEMNDLYYKVDELLENLK